MSVKLGKNQKEDKGRSVYIRTFGCQMGALLRDNSRDFEGDLLEKGGFRWRI